MIDLPSSIVDRFLEIRNACIGLETDTRKDLSGKLFFALKGDRFDGNQFIDQALQSGAFHAFTSDNRWEDHPNVTVIEDELGTLQALAVPTVEGGRALSLQ